MKHLKPYKLFEDIDDHSKYNNDLFEQITDSLMEIYDEFDIPQVDVKIISPQQLNDFSMQYPGGFWRYSYRPGGKRQYQQLNYTDDVESIRIDNLYFDIFDSVLGEVIDIRESIEGRIGKSLRFTIQQPERDNEYGELEEEEIEGMDPNAYINPGYIKIQIEY